MADGRRSGFTVNAGAFAVAEVAAKLVEADARLRVIRELVEANGCDCECGHDFDDHENTCEECLACRIGLACVVPDPASTMPRRK